MPSLRWTCAAVCLSSATPCVRGSLLLSGVFHFTECFLSSQCSLLDQMAGLSMEISLKASPAYTLHRFIYVLSSQVVSSPAAGTVHNATVPVVSYFICRNCSHVCPFVRLSVSQFTQRHHVHTPHVHISVTSFIHHSILKPST